MNNSTSTTSFVGRGTTDRALSRVVPLALIATAVLLGCFAGLDSAGLFDLDEGIYGTAARQMVESGDWITPRVGREPVFDKPPLAYWLQAVCMRFIGFTPAAARLPSALAAVATGLLLWWLAARRIRLTLAWMAPVTYVLCPLTLALARQATMDSILALWMLLAVIGWAEGYARDRRMYLLSAAAIGLAIMTKGIIGFLPGVAFVVWLALRRDLRALRGVPWLACCALLVAMVAPWHIAMWRVHGPVFIREYIIHHHIQRFLGEDFRHNAPVWYYGPVLVLATFPWIAYMVRPWAQGLRASAGRGTPHDRLTTVWAVWPAVVIGFFSISRSKLPGYILPALPPLALLAACRMDEAWQDRRGLNALEAALLALSGAALAAFFGVASWLGHTWRTGSHPLVFGRPAPDLAVEIATSIWIPAGLVAALCLVGAGAVLMRSGCVAWQVAATVGVSLAFTSVVVGIGLPAWARSEVAPLHDIARLTLPALDRGKPVLIYRVDRRRPSLHFVLGHPDLVQETFSAATARRVLVRAGGGYLLAESGTPVPLTPLSAHLVASADDWSLWRYDPAAAAPRRPAVATRSPWRAEEARRLN